MKRRFLGGAAALLLAFALSAAFVPASRAKASSQKVYDFAGLLSPAEEASLESRAGEFAEAHAADVVFLTASDTGGKSSMEYADDFYDSNGFGQGPRLDGALILINMAEREIWLSTAGAVMDAMGDADIDIVLDAVYWRVSGEAPDFYMGFCDALEALAPYAPGRVRPSVYDRAGVLSVQQTASLEQTAKKVSDFCGADVVFVIVNGTGSSSPAEYADEFFFSGGFGVGPDLDGAVLLIDASDDTVWLSTSGALETRLLDVERDIIIESVLSRLSAAGNDYFGAFMDGAGAIQQYAGDHSLYPSDTPRVYDFANLLSAGEEQDLENLCSDFRSRHGADLVMVTQTDTGGKSSRDYADDFYDYNGFGVGPGRDGALLLINMQEREIWLSTTGAVMDRMSSSDIDDVLDAVYYRISGSPPNYFAGLRDGADALARHATGSGGFVEVRELSAQELAGSAVIALACSLIFAAVVAASYKRGFKSYSFAANCDLNLSERSDVLINSHVSRTAIPRNNSGSHSGGGHSGGGGMHTSSSGSSHGGGGRHF